MIKTKKKPAPRYHPESELIQSLWLESDCIKLGFCASTFFSKHRINLDFLVKHSEPVSTIVIVFLFAIWESTGICLVKISWNYP